MSKMTIDVVGRPFARTKSRLGTILLLVLGLGLLGFGLWVRGQPAFVAWQTARDHAHRLGGRPTSRVWARARRRDGLAREHGTPGAAAGMRSAGRGGALLPLVDRVLRTSCTRARRATSRSSCSGPVRAPSGWSASVHGVHVHPLRAAGACWRSSASGTTACVRPCATSRPASPRRPPRPKLLAVVTGWGCSAGERVNGSAVAGSIPPAPPTPATS